MLVEEQPTWRLWGQECLDGAVYTVYLKKVRYHSPSRSITTDADDGISHLEWETVRVRFVKGGTLCRLVENLASPDTGELESTYINVFLATYRTFASPKQVLNLLTERYEQLAGAGAPDRVEQYRKTLRQALHVWLDQFPEDFIEPPNFPCLSHFENFCRRIMPGSELDSKVQRKGKVIRKEAREPRRSSDSPLIQMLQEPIGADRRRERYTKSQSLPHLLPSPSYSDILDISTKHFAQQITAMDNELFKRVIPHQCLGSVWSSKSRERDAATVVATIEQFNAVSYRVISTVLIDSEARPSQRARVVSAWVDVAQELRVLKNFSSLKAIVSGLQSNPIFRLKKAWQAVSREKLEMFEELARIFSEDNNAVAQRELLVREGTAKFADTAGEKDHHLQKVLQKHVENSRAISYGTIPYLGTFLTDLTMIDTAIPDVVSDGLINFDKRRKEFEVLAQIKLLQGAANAYHIETDAKFNQWFEAVLTLDEREAFDLSCKLEPGTGNASSSAKEKKPKKKSNGHFYHRKNDSIASTASSSSESQFYFDNDLMQKNNSSSLLPEEDPEKDEEDGGLGVVASPMGRDSAGGSGRWSSNQSSATSNNGGACTSVDSCSNIISSEPKPSSYSDGLNKSSNKSDGGLESTSDRSYSKSSSASKLSLTKPTTESPYKTSEFYIIRVPIESAGPETEGVIMYKSIMIGNHERTRQVIRNAMMKHGLEGSPDNYNLAQVLPDKELAIPPTANVYYAVSTQHDLNFILREKHEDFNGPSLNDSTILDSSVAGTPKSGSRKGSRDTSKARRKLMGIHL